MWYKSGRRILHHRSGAALIIVLGFVVLMTVLALAYFSLTVADRQVAQTSFRQTNADQLASSATAVIVADLKQEIINGSAAATPSPSPASGTVYLPTTNANMLPMRSGNSGGSPDPIPNLVRRSWANDTNLSVRSRASNVNSTNDVSANRRLVTSTRWNSHYLIPKNDTTTTDSLPIDAFTSATPDWVFVTDQGPVVITSPSTSVIGRYAYAIYDEGGLLNMNVAGYPTGTTAVQSGLKGSAAFADLTALGSSGISTSGVDNIVGWRNYATAKASGTFPTLTSNAATYFTFILSNTTGFIRTSGAPAWNGQTDKAFLSRQELINFRSSTGFTTNALQYLGTFSRAINSPSFSPSTPAGSSINYATLASSSTAVNPNFLLRRVTSSFTRFDGSPAVVGEPLVKTRFPLSRLAWITYKGPSATLQIGKDVDPTLTTPLTSDPIVIQLVAKGVTLTTIRAGTAANVKACFGLVWDSRAYVPASGTTPSQGQQWVYVSPSSSNGGGSFNGTSGNPASDIKRLDTVASENREPDFFELLRATILDGSLGQNTGGGVTGGATVFPDVHMSNKALHVLSIGASIIDQADPDSIPTRIQFKPPAATGTNWWTAYGVESLPYITQIYPISGISPATPGKWATYLLFQLSNPHNGPPLSPGAPQVRLRVDGGIVIFTGQTFASGTNKQTSLLTGGSTGQSIALTIGAFAPSSTPAPLYGSPAGSANTASNPAVGSASGPGGFESLPPPSTGTSIANYIGLRLLPDYTASSTGSGNKQITLYFGSDSTHQFNATMEYNAGGTTWVPYNYFIGINDPSSWINGATVPVRTTQTSAGTPDASASQIDQFNSTRLVDTPFPYSFMKADPRATRFGIFQLDPPNPTTARITDLLWPGGSSSWPNGYGGRIADGSSASPGSPVAHAPLRFSGSSGAFYYYPATFCINDGQSNSIRNTATTSYADNDGVTRSGDAVYPDPTNTSTGSSTPWSSYTVSGTTFRPYWPIIINRPFRSVGELGYVFRDLPWKSLDFFTDKSADAGLLDVFSISDEPVMVAGHVNLNTREAPPLQAILAGTIWDELNSSNSYSKAAATPDSAQTMAPLVVTATSTTPLLNRSELVSRTSLPTLPTQILPVSNQTDQLVKAQREAVPRALASVAQTRTWNLLIDVIAQSGRYPPTVTTNPNAADLPKFVVEGEQRYWVHVAIDRFTGQVIERQIEAVKE